MSAVKCGDGQEKMYGIHGVINGILQRLINRYPPQSDIVGFDNLGIVEDNKLKTISHLLPMFLPCYYTFLKIESIINYRVS